MLVDVVIVICLEALCFVGDSEADWEPRVGVIAMDFEGDTNGVGVAVARRVRDSLTSAEELNFEGVLLPVAPFENDADAESVGLRVAVPLRTWPPLISEIVSD